MEETTVLSPAEDAVLVGRARAGDGAALDELICRYAELIYRVGLGILGDPDQAADAAQEACVKVVRGLKGFRGESAVRTWMVQGFTNEARSLVRRRGRRRETRWGQTQDPPSPAPNIAEAVIAGDEVARVRSALACLPEKQRLAVPPGSSTGCRFVRSVR